jgi:hypothetical protein
MLVILIVGSCLLGWSGSVFAYIGYFETVNLDDGGFKDVFSADILATLRLEQEAGDSYPIDVWSYQFPPGTMHTLYDDGTRGDIEGSDGMFTYTFPSTGVSTGEEFDFYVDDWGWPPEGNDAFNGNTLTPATVTEPTVDQLVWNPVTGADSYLVGVWDTDHDFYHDGWVDFSNRQAEFETTGTSITDLGLFGVPEGTEYTYGIFAMGDGTAGKDGWSAAKGTLTATPEPVSSLLFLLGGISLIFCRRKNRRVYA